VSRQEKMMVERELGDQGVDGGGWVCCGDIWYLVCKCGDRAADHVEKCL
jgi:hypothetical protein